MLRRGRWNRERQRHPSSAASASEFTLTIPKQAETALDFALTNVQPDDFPLATDRTEHPSLLASSPSARVAWFYPAQSLEFSQLAVPKDLPIDDDTFGKSLAVLSVGDGRVYAVGVSNKNEVLLWKSDGSRLGGYIGCLVARGFWPSARGRQGQPRRRRGPRRVRQRRRARDPRRPRAVHLPERHFASCSFASLPAGALLFALAVARTEPIGLRGLEFPARPWRSVTSTATATAK